MTTFTTTQYGHCDHCEQAIHLAPGASNWVHDHSALPLCCRAWDFVGGTQATGRTFAEPRF
jgi:hypothetical protein